MRKSNWVLYASGDVSYKPENRDYFIPTDRLRTTKDLCQWVKHLRTKTWWDDFEEVDFYKIVEASFKIRGLSVLPLQKANLNGYYYNNNFIPPLPTGVLKDFYDEACLSMTLRETAEKFWYYESLEEFHKDMKWIIAFYNNVKKYQAEHYKK